MTNETRLATRVSYGLTLDPIAGIVGFFDALLFQVDDESALLVTEWKEITRQEAEQIAHEIRLGAWLNGFTATVDILT